MSTPARRESREPRTMLPDLLDLLEMPFTAFRPFAGQAMRLEDFISENAYTVRAEIPGIDPDKDLEVHVAHGILTIHAEREEEHEGRHRSEFRYGSCERQIQLPENVNDEEIKASYDKGILTIQMPLREQKEATRRVTVEH